MPTEDDLRDLLRTQAAPNRLDPKQVVRASRRRRVPQQIAAGSVGTLAIAAIAVFGIQTTQFGQGGQAESISAPHVAEDSSTSSEFAMKQLPAEQINRCGEPVAETVPSATGLALEVVDTGPAAAGTEPITATVRLTNTGSERVTGSTFGSPALTLSRDGVVVWHSNGAVDALDVAVDLASGESIDYSATFTPVECTAADEDGEAFRTDLPALPPGSYELSALFYFDSDAPRETTELDLISGPVTPITLQ